MSSARPRILLVDRYADVLETWAMYLRWCGYEVIAATDGDGAAEVAAARHPDLCLLDMDLPGLAGLDAAQRLHENRATAGIPVVGTTISTGLAERAGHLGVRVDAVIVKPCDPSALVATIERLITPHAPPMPGG